MEPPITLDHPNGVARTNHKKTRNRRPLPPLEARDWMTPNETALTLGCSVATVHRLRRGVIPGIEPLPYSRYGDWRRATGQEAEYVFRRSILSEIGELHCRDLKAEHLRAVLRKLAGTGLSYESVSKVRFAMGDMVKRMVAEGYLTSNIALA